MLVSITKSAAAVLLVGSALLVGSQYARADMMAEDSYNAAMDKCQNVMQGQRSFCMMNALDQYQAAKAMEEKKDVTIHYDYDASNDSPAQTQAKMNFEQAANKCANMQRGQRSLCMIDAHNKYKQEMGW
jgi:L-ascorbate metabolism protein UlaG (beta-lactamase superfamily)